MSLGNDNQIDWTATATPNEGMAGGLSRPRKPRVEPKSKREVMDTLLGQSDLSAFEIGGNDPYNATGRQFRR